MIFNYHMLLAKMNVITVLACVAVVYLLIKIAQVRVFSFMLWFVYEERKCV